MSVSVIIPVYNQEKWIRETLNSVKNQINIDFECIIINDGSTDGSLKIINKFINEDSRFIVYNQTNRGVSAARNLGIEKAIKQYITFLDGDDILELDALDVMYKSAQQKNVKIVIGKMQHRKYGVNKDIPTYVKYKVYNSGMKTLEKNPEILHSIGPTSKLFATDLIKDFRFPGHINFAEEHGFIVRAYQKSEQIYVIDKLVYNYIIRPNEESLSATQQTHFRTLEFMKDLMASHKEVFNILNGKNSAKVYKYYTYRITEYIMYPLLINAIKEPNFQKYSNLLVDYFNNDFFKYGLNKKTFTNIYYLKLVNLITIDRFIELDFYFKNKDVLKNTSSFIRIMACSRFKCIYYFLKIFAKGNILKRKVSSLINQRKRWR